MKVRGWRLMCVSVLAWITKCTTILGCSPADPVHPTKEETDRSYHDVVRVALGEAARGRARITVASHNPNSIQMAQAM